MIYMTRKFGTLYQMKATTNHKHKEIFSIDCIIKIDGPHIHKGTKQVNEDLSRAFSFTLPLLLAGLTIITFGVLLPRASYKQDNSPLCRYYWT